MRKKILVLSAFALVLSANLHAQVTFGGLTPPVPGAILDLNSTNKGGLILSNVALTDLSAIPSSFPKVSDQDAALKNGMKGALIYNTNENTCIGIHAWDGNHWARIASSLKSTGNPLSITSNWANAVGGDDIEFTVDTEAKTYTWYINENGAGYEYLAATTEPKLRTAIPAGTINVKVIADNCHVLEESNEVTLKPESLSPNFGSTDGGNYIYIYGDFPYAGTGDYIQDNLVVHYDAINNQALGDKSHSYTATDWKDLKNADDLPLFGAPASGDGWKANAFKFSTDTYFGDIAVPASWPQGNADRTVEITFRTPAAGWNKDENHTLLMYGTTGQVSKEFSVTYRFNGVSIAGRSFYFIGGNKNNYFVTADLIPALYEDFKLNTVTSTYSTNISDSKTRGILNGTYIPPLSPGTAPLNTGSSFIKIGNNRENTYACLGFEISSIRLYDCVLTDEEIQHNAALDQIRYLAPPTVTIDGVSCTEVVVLSEHFLMCKVPSTSPTNTGNKDVEITVGNNPALTLNGAYKYVHATNDFYVNNISRIIGSVGDPLTLTGNKFENIHEVKVGNIVCSPTSINYSGAAGTDTYTFTLPDLTGEVDITITMNDVDATTYRFAKIFEYKN
ncbi:MAG: IPT/TIG domain-containing protein [Dysgonamonadaceae bacterium]|jgi:hypothetical protein|nr:IPT/TIG domain-containing protein [Dysgonamonadaceae bacterium]